MTHPPAYLHDGRRDQEWVSDRVAIRLGTERRRRFGYPQRETAGAEACRAKRAGKNRCDQAGEALPAPLLRQV